MVILIGFFLGSTSLRPSVQIEIQYASFQSHRKVCLLHVTNIPPNLPYPMANFSHRTSSSLSGDRDAYITMPAPSESPHGSTADLRWRPTVDANTGKPSWRSLFFFTTRKHSLVIAIAIFSSLLSALLKPALAIFFGKIFSIFTKFGLGILSGPEALRAISKWCIALVSLGGAAWLIEGAFLSSWMVFGELQAKSVREQMFVGMLDKEMEWYDLRQDGIGSLLIRIQT